MIEWKSVGVGLFEVLAEAVRRSKLLFFPRALFQGGLWRKEFTKREIVLLSTWNRPVDHWLEDRFNRFLLLDVVDLMFQSSLTAITFE